ncbi:MAG: hypothetical protein GX316_03260 [Firmicutes bacterium]|nr:hypothetical protein [Bacillota bacterium]
MVWENALYHKNGRAKQVNLTWLALILAILVVLGSSARGNAFVGVRALGMGGAYTAVCSDGAAVFWNPAGLMQLETSAVTLALAFPTDGSASYRGSISYLEQDSGYGAGALTWYHLRDNPAQGPDGVLYDKTNDFSYSLAKPIGKHGYWGGTIHYTREKQADHTVGRWTGDLAALVRLSDVVQVGAALFDVYDFIGNQSHAAPQGSGSALQAGLSLSPNDQITIAVDGYDLLNGRKARSLRFGGEYRVSGGPALRAGLQRGIDVDWEAWSLGAGIDLNQWELAYAYLGGDYNGVHSMGFTWRF